MSTRTSRASLSRRARAAAIYVDGKGGDFKDGWDDERLSTMVLHGQLGSAVDKACDAVVCAMFRDKSYAPSQASNQEDSDNSEDPADPNTVV